MVRNPYNYDVIFVAFFLKTFQGSLDMTDNQSQRQTVIVRKTSETDIELRLDLDGSGQTDLQTGVPFLDHLLDLFGVHGFFNLSVKATGDTEIDDHHTVEDIGICIGQAIAACLGDKSSIARYGSCYLPMDETLVRVVVDISNRPYLHYEADVSEQKLGTFDTMLAKEFFRAVCQHAGLTLHIDLLHGENGHHIIEAIFKGFGRVMNSATEKLAIEGTLSSKGCL
jgi:imidazoleglycerol-phosphate dehydratase